MKLKKEIALFCEKIGRRCRLHAKKFVSFMYAKREAIGYYGILSLLLCVLATTAFYHRNENRNTAEVSASDETIMETRPALAEPDFEEDTLQKIWPLTGAIVGEYEAVEPVWSGILGQWQTHAAVDIAAAAGEAVFAVENGTVIDAYQDPLYGNTVAVRHEDGAVVIYASLNSIRLVDIGQSVSTGDVIGSAGECAAEESLGTHLHMEVWIDGETVDPLVYMRGE